MADQTTAAAAATATEPQLKEFTLDEVAAHNTAEDCWMIIGEEGERKVYDVTAFLDDHPGGPEIMVDLAGQDATAEFEDIGHSNDARAQLVSLLVGKVKGDVKKEKKVETTGKTVNGRKDVSGNNGPLFLVLAGVVGVVALFLQFGTAQ
ncbi:Cytochrome b5, partial [Globisporangium splendens]